MRSIALTLALIVAATGTLRAQPGAAAAAPMLLEAKIPLGNVSGRIDHLAVDVQRRRLLVAELGNNTLGVVDIGNGKVLRSVPGFRKPQGVGYEPSTDTIYVANAGDGAVQVLRGEDQAVIGRIELGSDADNVRIDALHRRVIVGYGNGALAIIDPAARAKTGEVRLPAHPESFRLIEDGAQAVVNLPESHQIAIVDLSNGILRSIPTGSLTGNFPMAVDTAGRRVLVGFRNPPVLAFFTLPDGEQAARVPICGDADDLFLDEKRRRIYVSCGAGTVDVLQAAGASYERLAAIASRSGARTALFVPELDRLYVAARAGWSEQAAILVFRPGP